MQGSLTTGSEYAQTLVSGLHYLSSRSLRREGPGDSILEFVSPWGSSRSLKAEPLLSHLIVQKYLPRTGKSELTHESGLLDLSLGSTLSSPRTAVSHLFCYCWRLYLFIFTKGEGRKKKEGKKHQHEKHWSGFQTPKTEDQISNPSMGMTENQTANLFFAGRCPTDWAALVRARVIFLMDHLVSLFSRTYSDSFPS